MSGVTVTALSYTPVKGTRLHRAERLELDQGGVPGDRRFYVIDERGRMLNGKQLGELSSVVADVDGAGGDELALRFPDGRVVRGPVREGARVETRFYSRPRGARLVEGPWAGALSEHVGTPVRLVATGGAVDRGARGGVSLISRASLARLAEEASVEELDARRFRMTVEVDGLEAHGEDAWVDGLVRVGEAVVRFHGHVGRCLITSRDPETGVIDVPTLDALAAYRGNIETTEPLAFGIYGEVLEPGIVAVGDLVAPVRR